MALRLTLRAFLLICLPALAATTSAHADTVFTFVNTYVHDNADLIPITGTVTLNTVTGKFTHTDITMGAGDGFQGEHFVDTYARVRSNGSEPTQAYFGLGPVLYLDFPKTVTNLIGYKGGDLCSEALLPSGVCTYYHTPTDSDRYESTYAVGNRTPDFSSGSLVDLSVQPIGGTGRDPNATPEPSSVALLGTGLFGLAGAERRRQRR